MVAGEGARRRERAAGVGEGRTGEPRWVVLFDSTHHVLAAERVFKERGVRCDLVPVPRDLSADCGMALEFRACDLEAVREAVADPRVKPRAVYRPAAGGHEEAMI